MIANEGQIKQEYIEESKSQIQDMVSQITIETKINVTNTLIE